MRPIKKNVLWILDNKATSVKLSRTLRGTTMLNNIGIMPFLLLGVVLFVIYLLQVRPARKRAKKNSTSTMYELSPSFWTGWGILLGGCGGFLLYSVNDPQIIGELMRASNPREAGSLVSMLRTTSYVLLGVGILLFGLGLAKSMFPPKPSD
jgi:cyanate permease